MSITLSNAVLNKLQLTSTELNLHMSYKNILPIYNESNLTNKSPALTQEAKNILAIKNIPVKTFSGSVLNLL
ncbi:MAG: hypothetical protein HRU28_04250 [Rhizobiales bacterium]|nr:hypothetical protein [Hyphomicrobiales bacterium]